MSFRVLCLSYRLAAAQLQSDDPRIKRHTSHARVSTGQQTITLAGIVGVLGDWLKTIFVFDIYFDGLEQTNTYFVTIYDYI